ncbi:helix-turn-helix transcriptional regulator [Variovorax sp. dw_954]|uniref:helix-turn-helix domain-containing protein n=1 Tax=Variovorax sp. dw_954 TaxID=2720078 RepID=UPI001BD3D194|nr:helix-turn-helix transcriptional regulator [Variovorax sp. dw_954]
MTLTTEITIEEGSTNVYAHPGYAEAAEMQRKSHLAAELARAIKARRLAQLEAAELLGIDQSKVSRTTRGHFRGVSEAKVLGLATRLGRDVKIVVGPGRRRQDRTPVRLTGPANRATTGMAHPAQITDHPPQLPVNNHLDALW